MVTGHYGRVTRWGVLLLLCVGALPVVAQRDFDDAKYAWDAGNYVEALEAFEGILTGPAAVSFHREIALTTGELYRTIEIALDGTAPTWSPNGRWIAYEVLVEGRQITHLQRRDTSAANPRVINGHGLRFAPSRASGAFIQVQYGSDLDAARADARSRIQVQDFQSFRRLQNELARVTAERSTIRIANLEGLGEEELSTPGIGVHEVLMASDGSVYFVGHRASTPDNPQIFAARPGGTVLAATETAETKNNLRWIVPDSIAVYDVGPEGFAILHVPSGRTRRVPGRSPAFSTDGASAFFLRDESGVTTVYRLTIATDEEPVRIYASNNEVANPAISPAGSRVVVQEMIRENWELVVVEVNGSGAKRITWEVQHDLFPRFLSEDRVFAVLGEGRHRRSYIHDLTNNTRTKVFHNNTVRTVAPEYEWSVSPDASAVLIVSERDGDTISPERGVYLTDFSSTITRDQLIDRVRNNLAAERRLRENGRAMFAPIQSTVRDVVANVSTARIYAYAADLFSYGSKFITEPGNALAIDYLVETLQSFGYEPELQWFEPRPGIRTANVIATLEGSSDSELVYVVSSHFDSVNRGPGADDNSSGTTALLEAARVLRHHPQRATIKFAFFTGEEAGLLGSREFVRRAVRDGDQIVGALNNDMVGYANDHKLDNTIRYSNAGIRDLQHAAAFLFTDLITYDAKYYKSTDAHAYYEAYGDIVGGIGSYPILGNPHYHQSHDVLETINQPLVAEVSKTTVASLMLLASSPSRLKDVAVTQTETTATLSWSPAPESNIKHYRVRHGTEEFVVTENRITIRNVRPGARFAVKAVNTMGLASWDWAQPQGSP